MIRRVPLLLAVAAAGAAILACVSPALASLATQGRRAAGSVRAAPHALAALPGDGAMWTDKAQGAFTLSATVVLPKLKCGRATQAIQVTVGGVGAAPSWAGDFVGCDKGKARYFPWLVDDLHTLQAPGLAAHAGDRVVLSVSVNSKRTVVSVADKTTKRASKKLTGPGGFGGGLEVGTLPVSRTNYLGVPKFGTLTYSHVVVDGKPFGAASSLTAYAEYNRRGTLLISVSPFSSNRETFRIIFHHS